MSDTGFDAFDPNAPEGDSGGKSQYVTKRDLRVVGAALVVLAACCWPVYKMLERKAQRSVCATNLGSIATAISQYAALHDDRFPPIMRTGPGNQPDLGTSGYPYTWASDIIDLMSPRSTFVCPSAEVSEITKIEGHNDKPVPITYGMYEPYGGYLRTIIANPDQTVLISETSNHGAESSFDPIPLTGPGDGFVIGWNNVNENPNELSTLITRLALRGTSNGVFKKTTEPRHDGGIFAINCNGAAIFIKPTEANVQMYRKLPGGLWQAPPQGAH